MSMTPERDPDIHHRESIRNNPANWELDAERPDARPRLLR